MNIPSFINAFDKKTEELAFSIKLFDIKQALIEEIFDQPISNMQANQFEISGEQAKALNKILNLDINIDKYDYFLDCDKRKKGSVAEPSR